MKIRTIGLSLLGIGTASFVSAKDNRPNIIYIMSDDHTSQAISAYGGILANILPTPNLDRIANEGVRLTNCFVTNSISTPSRAAIITGQYSQKNGVYSLDEPLDVNHPNVAKNLQQAGYATGIIGKWHLVTEPQGFDYYNIFPGHGRYKNPILIEKGMWGNDPNIEAGPDKGKEYEGHETDVLTDEALRFIDNNRDKDKPFFLMCHYKAPHRTWIPAERFNDLLKDVEIPEPQTLLDSYKNKGKYTQLLQMGMEHLKKMDLKIDIPDGMTKDELRHWAYQYYLKDYLRCVAGIDENVGRILDYLDKNGLTENTIIVYTGDQGFLLGEHGWFDKRLMYEECLRMPFLMRYPKEIKPGSVNEDIILNIDFAPLFLDYAERSTPSYMQGKSFRKNLVGKTISDWRKAMYYRYWMNSDYDHNVIANYGIRTDRYKLVFYYGQPLGRTGTRYSPADYQPEWELYDLKNDPLEMNNVYNDPLSSDLIKKLKIELLKLKQQYEDEDSLYPEMKDVVDKYFW